MVLILVLPNLVILLGNIALLALNVKLYTEILKIRDLTKANPIMFHRHE